MTTPTLSPVKISEVHECAERLNAKWRRATDDILEIAADCIKAFEKLTTADTKKEFFKNLVFSPATFSKLCHIGRDPRLQDEEVKSLLPPKYSVMYEVTQLTTEELNEAIDQEVLKPDTRRSDLIAWRDKRRGKSRASQTGGDGAEAAPTEVYEAAFIFYRHTKLPKSVNEAWIEALNNYHPRKPGEEVDEDEDNPGVVVVRRPKDDPHFKYDFVDRFCDQDGDPVSSDGELLSPTGIRRKEETVHFDNKVFRLVNSLLLRQKDEN